MGTLGDYGLPIAMCRLLLKGDHWLPFGIDTEITPAHRSSPNGPVIWAHILAAVDGDRVVAWGKPFFTVQKIDSDGNVEERDLSRAVNTVSASSEDAKASARGAIGINKKLLDRKSASQEWPAPKEMVDKVYERAVLMIRDKVHGGRATGVLFTKSHRV